MSLVDENNIEEYKEFLQTNERAHFLQSPEWAKVKTSWKNETVLALDENKKIVGSLSIHIRKIPVFGNIMYSPRGPVCDIHNVKVLKDLTDGAKELAKKYNAFVLKIEPDILSSDSEFRNIVSSLDYKIKDDAKNFKEEIQPRYVFRLDIKGKTEDEIFKAFHEKTRYNVRLATKKGVQVRIGSKDDLKDFHKIMIETGSRDGFIIRSLEYFEKMYDEMAPKHMQIYMAYYQDKPVAGTLEMHYGNKTWYLYGASSNEYRNVMPNYLLQWEMIKDALKRGSDIFDFRGVSGVVDENHPQYGLYRFKKGFNAEFTEFIGEVYIPFKPIVYKVYQISEKLFRTVRAALRRK